VLARELVDEQPLLLLDDVMSELDESRRAAILSFIENGIQTIITTTNLGYFPDEILDAARVVTY
jgi:DNA replication and repair protein RecF